MDKTLVVAQPAPIASHMAPFPPDVIPMPTEYTVGQPQQEQDLSDAVSLLRETGLPEYSFAGATIKGTVQEVPIRELWINPFLQDAMRYKDRDKAELKASIHATPRHVGNKGVIEPIIVTPIVDPLRKVPRGRSLLVISGARRVAALDLDSQDYITVIIQRYKTFFDAIYASITVKISPLSPDPLQKGYLIQSLRIAHDMENQYRYRMGQPALPFLTQEEIAERVGCDRSWVSICERIANLPSEIRGFIHDGWISADRAKDLLAVEGDKRRLSMARRWAQKSQLEEALSREEARAEVANEQWETKQIGSGESPSPRQRQLFPDGFTVTYSDLWTPGISPNASALQVIGCTAHDLYSLLSQNIEQAKQQNADIHPALTRLRRALADPAIQEFVTSLKS